MASTAGYFASPDLTTAAIRQHLSALETVGLVQAEPLPTTGAARGRPAACWALTAEAVALFPDRHAELTVELIDADPRSSSTPTPGARAAAQPPRTTLGKVRRQALI